MILYFEKTNTVMNFQTVRNLYFEVQTVRKTDSNSEYLNRPQTLDMPKNQDDYTSPCADKKEAIQKSKQAVEYDADMPEGQGRLFLHPVFQYFKGVF